MRFGLTHVQVGMAAGWIASGFLVADATQRGGLRGFIFGGAFIWGVIASISHFQQLHGKIDKYERALKGHGVDPTRIY